ncbi:PH, RCC1 and FYVE domains-containing protein 1 isoform X2 [Cryptomeria japonica]|uniref:PH, RCC1 and FYVE domains-containing protein 1 isoform X2 n=1 Tax=Cryptomeria japonica TaxID=3369 RepID=UPI0027DA8D5D|nr:PH, RCC1 and FYVE domains-containing protein 1 isoform X2 [Cryptomeria japonica]
MQMEGISLEKLRVSVSSALSSSSQGSAQDDYDVVGDVYVWGELIWDSFSETGAVKTGNGSSVQTCTLRPKRLESALVLDVHNIACGGKHAALITRQGELFTWGQESGGRLGYAVGTDVSQPQLVDTLANNTIKFAACGEYHTCAVTNTGELYTWGDGIHNIGLLGHGNCVAHWIPRKVSGCLDRVKVNFISCGAWHAALITTGGQLFTFGDGTFGVLGHGDCKSVIYPREVEALKGLQTVRVACGVWHTAAVVDCRQVHSSPSNCFWGSLFTWGNGDKGRLGHGDKEQKLVPVCVSTLREHNIQEVACGHSLTVALASGKVFTMGSNAFGQLGNPNSNGMLPSLVEGKLAELTVEEVACGAYHVAVLTSRKEVYTWGKGANGRLGHGNVDDCQTPMLVGDLKEKEVKKIACGSNFTAAICLHKRVLGAVCSGCRQSFGLTRKRRNCYNCGQVYCHSCSSKKAMKAALAPYPNKAFRVCDSCYLKLKKAPEIGINLNNKKKDKFSRPEIKIPRTPWRTNLEQFKQSEGKAQAKHASKIDQPQLSRGTEISTLLQLNDMNFLRSDPSHTVSKMHFTSFCQVDNGVRALSPLLRKTNPLRSATPTPTMAGLTTPKYVIDDLKKTNEILTLEMQKLRVQVEKLTKQCQCQEDELQRTADLTKETVTLAVEESVKCKAAKEVIRSLTTQLKDMAEKLPGEYVNNGLSPTLASNLILKSAISNIALAVDHQEVLNHISILPPTTGVNRSNEKVCLDNEVNRILPLETTRSSDYNYSGLPKREVDNGHEAEIEKVEEDETGVYLTLLSLPDGTKYLKRVRFSEF